MTQISASIRRLSVSRLAVMMKNRNIFSTRSHSEYSAAGGASANGRFTVTPSRNSAIRTVVGLIAIRFGSREKIQPTIVTTNEASAQGQSTPKPHTSLCGFMNAIQSHNSTPTNGRAIATGSRHSMSMTNNRERIRGRRAVLGQSRNYSTRPGQRLRRARLSPWPRDSPFGPSQARPMSGTAGPAALPSAPTAPHDPPAQRGDRSR